MSILTILMLSMFYKDSVPKIYLFTYLATYQSKNIVFSTHCFANFITSFLECIDRELPEKSAIIMDNVPFHKSLRI